MKLFKIAFSNIKKRKSSAITLFVITLISALMLSISLSLIFNISSFYDDKRKELNAPDITFFINESIWQDDMLEYAKGYNDVKNVELTDYYFANANYFINNEKKSGKVHFISDGILREMNAYKIIDKLEEKPDGYSILLSLGFKYRGIKPGDMFSIQVGESNYDFTVYGFFEDAHFQGQSTGEAFTTYVSLNAYEKISSDKNFIPRKVLSLQFNNLSVSYDFENEFSNKYSLNSTGSMTQTYDGGKTNATTFSSIMGYILILIAVIVIIIALIIVRFSIINNIQEDIRTIGALKGLGYTSSQITRSLILQFCLIALAGSIIGVLAGLACTGLIGNLVVSTSGLLWGNPPFLVPALISAATITGISLLVAYFAARKSRKITPIKALRAGIETHNFKKDSVPLDKTKLPFSASMAAKNFMYNKRSNITAFIVIFLFAFLTVITSVLYHNFAIDNSALMKMVGQEGFDVQVSAINEQAAEDYFDDIGGIAGVRKTLKFDTISATSNNKLIEFNVWEDIGKKEDSNVVKGRYPKSNNEISITAYMQSILNKNVEDVINIEYEGKTESYLICGITQGMGAGILSDMTYEGFTRLSSEQEPVLKSMAIYLNSSDLEKVDEFINSINADYAGDIVAFNINEMIEDNLDSIGGPMTMTSYLIVGITIFVICFAFFLLVSTIMRNRKKDFGIMKALGFSNKQIIIQLILSFLPVIIVSLVLGLLAGIFLSNPLLALIMNSMGVIKSSFIIPVALIAVAEAVLLIICILAIYLISLKTRRISPHKLITE